MSNIIQVEVAYALPEKQKIMKVDVADGATAMDAVMKSGITNEFVEIDIATVKLGVFGKAVKNDAILRAGDRVEIYRPLIADPKLARKKRASDEKTKSAKSTEEE